jgi:hypothetical protein
MSEPPRLTSVAGKTGMARTIAVFSGIGTQGTTVPTPMDI